MSPPNPKKESPSAPPRLGGSGKLLLAYYGDDFTGSTDVMEALARAGLRTVLFLAPPTEEQLEKFPGLRAFGIAGGSRTMSPAEVERELPPAFEALKASGAPIVHYKVCSTFDSSPAVGSIGRAIEIGRRVFGNRPTPLVVGAPVLGRYVVFGNLFARSGLDSEPSRLDRHPTMSRHPVTPMDEADLRLHLTKQTKLQLELVDVLKLEHELSIRSSRGDEAQTKTDQSLLTSASTESEWAASADGAQANAAPIVLFDTLREAHLAVIGGEIGRLSRGEQIFVVGSSGVEYALVEHWRRICNAETQRTSRSESAKPSALSAPLRFGSTDSVRPAASKQIVAVSGSCSPVTDRQVARALKSGFVEIPLHAKHLARENYRDSVRTFVLLEAQRVLADGRSVVLQTSRGPTDPRMVRGKKSTEGLAARLGQGLGLILDDLLNATGIRRAVVCGGDTSMHVARTLGIESLEYLAPMAPGSPLCKVHAPGRAADGCEIVFKGGQVGRDDFFLDVLNGGPS